ncbi:MAG: ribonuclease HII [Inquilinus sp.]|nr:ribonuclease HII [Inquilinus sp.]
MPDLILEFEAGAPTVKVAGVDEVGRGPLAGPVVAAAVVLPAAGLPPEIAESIDDSKKLKAGLRQTLATAIHACCAVGIGKAEVAEIDAINILQATFLAMARAVAALPARPALALIDGNRCPPDLPCRGLPVIGGDRRSLSIAAASIVAKVARDRLMAELGRLHPGYGWDRNAGYGTAEHLRALERLGVTPHHRRSFAPVSRQLSISL